MAFLSLTRHCGFAIKNMIQETSSDSQNLNRLAEDAQAFMTATADVAGEKIENARKRLAVALDGSKELYDKARAKAIEGAKAADDAIVDHPYQALAIGVGIGAIVGFLLARRGACSRS